MLTKLLVLLGLRSDDDAGEPKSSRLREMWNELKPADVSVFEAIELLVRAITSKRLLWMALHEIAPAHPALAAVDFHRMQEEAREQRGLLERGLNLGMA